MQQLTGLDASFLYMETGAQFGHVGSLTLYDPREAHEGSLYKALRHSLPERLHLLPPFRRRIVEVPFGLDHPYWVEDPNFDLDFHLRHIAVPPPGTNEQLAELVSHLHAIPLDRSRPLWQLWVIEGLESGQVARGAEREAHRLAGLEQHAAEPAREHLRVAGNRLRLPGLARRRDRAALARAVEHGRGHLDARHAVDGA
ncbi:MAG TPA: wax ester/triacylglycerol synthase domain-containing protein, partial [Myxococcota bacterium]|nr:wax ester/triacylglycerol synthase domain-containing protein [Myxococcota bacterium]